MIKSGHSLLQKDKVLRKFPNEKIHFFPISRLLLEIHEYYFTWINLIFH